MRRVRRNRWWMAVAVALALVSAAAAPAVALDEGDFTGDITDPQIVDFALAPRGADVTSEDGNFAVRLPLTDDMSGITNVSLVWESHRDGWSYGVNVVRTSGTANDGIWTGTFSIPRGTPPGRYPFLLAVSDRVGNDQTLFAEDLDRRGFPSGVDITNSDPDATAPSIVSVAVTPDPADARSGPVTVRVTVRATDAGTGVKGGVVFLLPPDHKSGAQGTGLSLVNGDARDGTWSGTAELPEHTRAGRWGLEVRMHDFIHNQKTMNDTALATAGLVGSFTVQSHEDSVAPTVPAVSIEPAELDVHDADRTVRVRIRATDDVSGIMQPWSDTNFHSVHASITHPIVRQSQGNWLMPRVSGDARDGFYEATFTVPKSSATGLWMVEAGATDKIGNSTRLTDVDLVAAGGLPAILVYNTPLPPLPIDAIPGDGLATVRWDPPVDSRGAEVTEYVVRTSPGGTVARVPGDVRSAVVSGLANGTSHRFEILAVNKAGPSDPSAPLTATPTARASAASESTGYRMVANDGSVYAFGSRPWLGNAAPAAAAAVDIEGTPSGRGYWITDAAGRVSAFGDAPWLGGAGRMAAGETVTSLSGTPSGNGYWLFTTLGRVLAFGDAPWLGEMSGVRLNGPVLDSVPTPTGNGYYMVASDGGVFTFGDAAFAGSMGGQRLNAPVQSLVPDPDGSGYWLVASDGGIFSLGAPFHGSMGALRLNRPITGMVGSPTGGGYLMVGEDGGIFTFGDVDFHGSLGDRPPRAGVSSVSAR